MALTLSPEDREIIQREFIAALRNEGMVVVPKFVVEFEKRKMMLLKRKSITPFMIEKYKLLNGVTRKTVMNMIKDGRIRTGEWYKDSRGITYVLTMAIKRINNE